MKRTTLFLISGLSLGVVLSSCNNEGSANKQQLYNNYTKTDTEGFTFFKSVHEKAMFEMEFAKYAATVSNDPKIASISEKISSVYTEMIPQLEELAAEAQVILPDPGTPEFEVPVLFALDTAASFDVDKYLKHLAKQQKEIVKQFKRASRNTNQSIRKYAGEKLPVVEELYVFVGGESDKGGHH